MNKLLIYLICTGLALASHNSLAHHCAAANFHSDKPITIEGVITRYNFRNPHVNIFFDVENNDGTTTNWMAEGESATTLSRAGWTNNTLSSGDKIRVSGNSSLDGSPMVWVLSAATLDPNTGSIAKVLTGVVDESREAQAAAFAPLDRPTHLENGLPNLSGLWHGEGSPYLRLRDPDMPFNDVGRALQAAYQETNDPQVFCQQPGIIRQAGMTHYGIRITQAEDHIILEYEEYGNRRIIYFDDRGTLGIHTHFGDSIARYEGDILIIETTNLLPNMATAEGNRLSDQTKVIQTFERTDESGYGAVMRMTTITTDPVYLAEDFVLVNGKVAVEDQEFIEVDCNPPLRERQEVHPYMNFFLTSEGLGDGADLGGLEGADAHCESLAARVDQGDKNWIAYLSTTGQEGVNAIDRIGEGPWYNAEGQPIALNTEDLHTEASWLVKDTVLTERGARVNGRGNTPNRHDILTGSDLKGMAVNSDSDTTCSNWTSNDEGSALVGHFDREGGGNNPTSWNSAHGSRGCSQENLQASGGDGLFYCFAN